MGNYVPLKCQYCGDLFMGYRPLFIGERDRSTCPRCTATAIANTEKMSDTPATPNIGDGKAETQPR